MPALLAGGDRGREEARCLADGWNDVAKVALGREADTDWSVFVVEHHQAEDQFARGRVDLPLPPLAAKVRQWR